MAYLLFNTSFKNRGDGLMNLAIESHYPNSTRWAVPASLAARSPEVFGEYALYPDRYENAGSAKNRILNSTAFMARLGAKCIPVSLRSKTPIVLERDIKAAFDVSGYSYGDFWGQERVEAASRQYRRLKEAGVKIILMPKTWGPFKEIDPAAVKKMFDYVDIGFARDDISLQNLREILDTSAISRLHFAPDYTHEIDVSPSTEPGKHVYLIPNSRVIDSETAAADSYLQLFTSLRSKIKKRGFEARLLIHELSNDRAFISKAGAMGFEDQQVEIAESALDAKRRIAGSRGVLTSRLHGLYNALNNQIPVIVVGWNFKYQAALEKYNVSGWTLETHANDSEQDEALDKILDEQSVSEFREFVSKGKKASAEETAVMWGKIDAVLSSNE